MYTNNFCFGYITVSCFFESFPGGWLWVGVAGLGWVVGKTDFNENPVFSLDLDFGLRLRVCQNFKKTSSVDSEIQNDDTTLDENLQKMILSRPVDEKNFSDIMVTALGLVNL